MLPKTIDQRRTYCYNSYEKIFIPLPKKTKTLCGENGANKEGGSLVPVIPYPTSKEDAIRNLGRYSSAYWGQDLWSDKDCVLAAVAANPNDLLLASDALRNDPDVVLCAIRRDESAIRFAPAEMQANKELVLSAIGEGHWKVFGFVSQTLQDDPDVARAAIAANPQALRWASERLRARKNIVVPAVKKDCDALQWAADSLRYDKEVIIAAVKRDYQALRFVSGRRELYDDKDIMLAAVRNNCLALTYASDNLRSDMDVVLEAVRRVKTTGDAMWVIAFIDGRILENREAVIRIVSQNGFMLSILPDFKDDREVVFAAICQKGNAISFASEDVQQDRDFILRAVRQNGRVFAHVNDKFKADREIALAAVQNTADAIRYAAPELRADRELGELALLRDPYNLQFVGAELRRDERLVLAATKRRTKSLLFADWSVFTNPIFLKEVVLSAAPHQRWRVLSYAIQYGGITGISALRNSFVDSGRAVQDAIHAAIISHGSKRDLVALADLITCSFA